jgi:hypothetical protein
MGSNVSPTNNSINLRSKTVSNDFATIIFEKTMNGTKLNSMKNC